MAKGAWRGADMGVNLTEEFQNSERATCQEAKQHKGKPENHLIKRGVCVKECVCVGGGGGSTAIPIQRTSLGCGGEG